MTERLRCEPDPLALAEWQRLRAVLARVWSIEACEELERFEERYCRENPLRDAQKDALIAAFDAGGQLCCAKGKRLLDRLVDPIWSGHLNDWAYDSLACTARITGVLDRILRAINTNRDAHYRRLLLRKLGR